MSVYSAAIPKRIVEESPVTLHLRQTGAYHIVTGVLGLIHVIASLICAWAWLYLAYATFFMVKTSGVAGVSETLVGRKVATLLLGVPTLWFCVWAFSSGMMLIARFEDIKIDVRLMTVTHRIARFPLLWRDLGRRQLHFSHLAEIQVLPTLRENWKVVLALREGEPLGVDVQPTREDAIALAQKIASLCNIPWRVIE